MKTEQRIKEHLDDYTLNEHPEIVESRAVQNSNRYTVEVKHSIPSEIIEAVDADLDLSFRIYPTDEFDGEGNVRIVVQPSN